MPDITYDELCLTVMRELGDVAGTNADPLKNAQKTGLLSALQSGQNLAGAEIDRMYNDKTGKIHRAIVKYMKPASEADVTDTVTSICDEDGTAQAYAYDEVAISSAAQSEVFSLDEAQMQTLCESGNEFRLKYFGSMINAVDKNINKKLIPLFYAGAGGILNGGGNVGQAYDLLYRDGQVQIDPEQFILMQRDIMDTGAMGSPIIVGGGNLDMAMRLQQIACCNAFGADPSQMAEMQYYYDNDIALVLDEPSDSNAFFVFMPGAAQLVDRAKYYGQFRKVNDLFIHDTITSPKSGITYDVEMKYDDCTGTYKWKLSVPFGLWQLPTDVFKASDERYGINFNWVMQANEGAPSA